MSGTLPFYFDESERRFSGYLRGVWPSQSDRSLGVAGGSSLSSLLWADSLFLSASKGSGHWVMYTPFLLLLVSPRYRLALPDGEDASEGVSLGASLPSLAWLSRGSSGGGVMITSCGSILVSKHHFHSSLSFLSAYSISKQIDIYQFLALNNAIREESLPKLTKFKLLQTFTASQVYLVRSYRVSYVPKDLYT